MAVWSISRVLYSTVINLIYRLLYRFSGIFTKSELVSAIAEKAGYTKKDAEKALCAVVDTITETLANGEKVSIVGFGTFEVRDRAAKESINPATKQPVHCPAKKVPAFKAGKALKEIVDKK